MKYLSSVLARKFFSDYFYSNKALYQKESVFSLDFKVLSTSSNFFDVAGISHTSAFALKYKFLTQLNDYYYAFNTAEEDYEKRVLRSSAPTSLNTKSDGYLVGELRELTGAVTASSRLFCFTKDSVLILNSSSLERPFHGYGTINFNAIASDGIGVWYINREGVFRADYNRVQMISRNIYSEPMFPNHTDQELKEISAAIDSELRWYIISDPKDKRFYIFNIDTLKPTKGSLEFSEFDYSHPTKLMSFNGKVYGILNLSITYTTTNPPSSTTYNEYSIVKLFDSVVSDTKKESGFQYLQNVEYSNRLTKTFEFNEIRKTDRRHRFARYIEFYYKCDQVVTITVYKKTDSGKEVVGSSFELPISTTLVRKKARIDSMIGLGFTIKAETTGELFLERMSYD